MGARCGAASARCAVARPSHCALRSLRSRSGKPCRSVGGRCYARLTLAHKTGVLYNCGAASAIRGEVGGLQLRALRRGTPAPPVQNYRFVQSRSALECRLQHSKVSGHGARRRAPPAPRTLRPPRGGSARTASPCHRAHAMPRRTPENAFFRALQTPPRPATFAGSTGPGGRIKKEPRS